MIVCFFVIAICLPFIVPKYWEYAPETLDISIPSGTTQEGHPWIGAENPELSIVEFSDYMCFQCLKMHIALRKLVQQHPEKIRLIHVNFPLDHTVNPLMGNQPYHIGAAKLALLAEYASTQKKFWLVNDTLFQIARKNGGLDLYELSDKTGLNADDLARSLKDITLSKRLLKDIRKGLLHNVNSTPSYLVNNKIYVGTLPKDLFEPDFSF